MGELISLAERRAARAERGRAARAPARELLLRPRVAVDVPGRRARRSALRRRALAAGHRRGAAGRRATRGRAARRGRGARRRAADAAGVARAAARGRTQRDARRRPGRRARPRRGVRAGRQPPGLLRRLRRRRPRDPGRGGRRRRPGPRRTACTPPASVRRDGPMEQAALRLLGQGADALPVLVVGRALFCGEHRLRRGRRGGQRAPPDAPAGAPHASAAEPVRAVR